MQECQACRSKGSRWPGHLDFSRLMPYQKSCPWCNGTKQVTSEVAGVFDRLVSESGVLTTRAVTLTAIAIDAENAWQQVRGKKRPKHLSEPEWQKELLNKSAAVANAKQEAELACEMAQLRNQ